MPLLRATCALIASMFASICTEPVTSVNHKEIILLEVRLPNILSKDSVRLLGYHHHRCLGCHVGPHSNRRLQLCRALAPRSSRMNRSVIFNKQPSLLPTSVTALLVLACSPLLVVDGHDPGSPIAVMVVFAAKRYRQHRQLAQQDVVYCSEAE